jgi:hypothetical protein
MKTYDVEIKVMVERTVWFSVECDSEFEEDYELDDKIYELAEDKYFSEPYNIFEFDEETAEIEVNNYKEQ